LGERLAALAVKNCRAYPGVEIHNIAFENWVLEEKAFDLAISVNAFHRILPEVGYPKVARALKASGSAIIVKGIAIDPQTEWSRAIDEVYLGMSPPIGLRSAVANLSNPLIGGLGRLEGEAIIAIAYR
jgi:hypothetical protein